MSAATELRLRIGDGWPEAAGGRSFETIEPYTGRPWARVPDAGPEDVDAAVAAARDALAGDWAGMPGSERARLIRRLADLVERHADALGRIESRDNGKLLREMQGQMRYLPEWFRYFAGLADKLHGEALPTDKPAFFAYTRHEPVGVVAAIVPWNSPLLLLGWKLAPGLAAGCTFVVKPSEHTPASALAFARLAEEAGFPPGVLNVVTASRPDMGRALVEHPGVDKVAFTGSTEVGVQVGRAAMARMARALLELGGKSAQVVWEDADLEAAANGVIAGIFAAGGQSCMAGSRLVVHHAVADELVERIAARARTIALGDPADPRTEMGPLATRAQLERVQRLVGDAVDRGARVVCGGGQGGRGGLFYEPTILREVPAGAAVRDEEVFGPVLIVEAVGDEPAAVAAANRTRFGLAAGVWTRDVHRAHRLAHALRAGTVWINAYRVVSPDVPFGGMGLSGIGRESGMAAVHEYTETKSVWVELSGRTRDPFVLG